MCALHYSTSSLPSKLHVALKVTQRNQGVQSLFIPNNKNEIKQKQKNQKLYIYINF